MQHRVSRIEFHYEYAGCKLRTHFPLPELVEVDAFSKAAFHVVLAAEPPAAANVQWRHDFSDPAGQVTLTCERTPRDYRLNFPGVAMVVALPGGDLRIYQHVGTSMESVRHVLLDQALPRLIAQRGELVLHAAVVRTRAGRTLLLMGDSGRGKSTLTGAFFASGRTVANDDGAVVRVSDGELLAIRTYPSLRLLPDSRAHLFADEDTATLPVADYSDKRRLQLHGAMGESRVDAIVLLATPPEGSTLPQLSRETPGQACMAMIQHGFQLDLSDIGNIKALLAQAAEAALLVPVYQLHYPRRYDVLPEVIDLLEREI